MSTPFLASIMNSQTSMRPFSKAISVVSGTEELNIQLTDTAGTLVDCNYIRVDTTYAVGAGGSGYFYVRPGLSYNSTTTDPSGAGAVETDPGAGVAISGPNTGSITIRTGHETFTKVHIGNAFVDTTNFVITYGFEQPINPMISQKGKRTGA